MLYVFQVDTGDMMTFEMRWAMDKVGNLKKAIAAKTEIPEDKQVLLISGGESLSNLQRVCSYSSAGTDTSPIFLFAKINIESAQPPTINYGADYDDDRDTMEMIESCMSMQPSLDTLVARTELATDLQNQAIGKKETCEKLVHDQHLQQQGWAAVTANLEDLTRAFKNKAEMLLAAISEFTKREDNHKALLKQFEDDIKRLDAIPILPTLIENNKFIHPPSQPITTTQPSSTHPSRAHGDSGSSKYSTSMTSSSAQTKSSSSNSSALNTSLHNDVVKDTQQQSTTSGVSGEAGPPKGATEDTSVLPGKGLGKSETETALSKSKSSLHSTKSAKQQQPASLTISEEAPITLRQWIDYHDSQNSLERLIELCCRGLERFTDANADHIRTEVQELLKSASNSSMKEIKGLEERLFGLEKLMVDAKKVVDEQIQLAASFQNNKERFSKIKDLSLLPDLSASHVQQLQMMLVNHKKMNDYRTRCLKAKCELSVNLHARLKWIMYIEQQISDLDGKLMIYKENLLRLNRHFEIVDQVHKSPDLYLASVVEALRRRRFSRRYLHWTSSIAKISQELYDSEMEARKEFDSKLGSHFLSNLFPGLTRSYPPSFANVAPDPFDTKLPRITAADIQYLQANLSDELVKNLVIPRDVPMPHIISAPKDLEDSAEGVDDDDRHSLNPTPPSSPQRQQQDED